ncbi:MULTISPECIES: tetratricopeptide repeat protein [Enterococcus]|jgi:predicted nuclease with TOPRIM domain|uniref:Tetratricopeptide repeat protein n=1 Tax=Enterococcus raffinosus TaxID=71452 RepID=A0AAW8TDJ2_9ENTE|nr:tetratricopeptide repeat protein [Enterococcus raffinosus]MDT2524318.1 tetratricopeptide repeat protein [Enterococcus raffinosus]MDT2530547.1 tetratricopeptide repeat protein [Enterococcus raffinosus]MDT2535251.1 tetratricopeptide repeat protein [Enterococcus raffinosus]MDT2545197.1 tetratricopeptide repeat protein [Enterococcus raffinosus]MDT2578716.1 tetratricopeptide repeat protein [Enterococcus raffinosus]
MFGFFKKKSKPEKTEEKVELSTEEKDRLNEDNQQLLSKISATSDDQTELARLHEQLGLNYAKLEQTDNAIESLEKSLEEKLTIGDGYKKLMSLYNGKRAEAARNGDDAGIEKYMSKMDEMRQIAKKVTISG